MIGNEKKIYLISLYPNSSTFFTSKPRYKFRHPHTAERIIDSLKEVCNEYEIWPKVNFIVSDNAANVVKAIKNMG